MPADATPTAISLAGGSSRRWISLGGVWRPTEGGARQSLSMPSDKVRKVTKAIFTYVAIGRKPPPVPAAAGALAGSISHGSLFLTLPTRRSTGHTTMFSAG